MQPSVTNNVERNHVSDNSLLLFKVTRNELAPPRLGPANCKIFRVNIGEHPVKAMWSQKLHTYEEIPTSQRNRNGFPCSRISQTGGNFTFHSCNACT